MLPAVDALPFFAGGALPRSGGARVLVCTSYASPMHRPYAPPMHHPLIHGTFGRCQSIIKQETERQPQSELTEEMLVSCGKADLPNKCGKTDYLKYDIKYFNIPL